MGDKIQILVVDDHQVVREGLRHLLELEGDFEFIGQGANSEESLFQIEMLSPDIVLMDIKMPGIDGIQLTRLIKEKQPSCNIIMLTLYDQYLTQAMEAGARGYLLKDAKREELAQAIRQVHNGQVAISQSITSRAKLGGETETIQNGQFIPEPVDAETRLEEVRLVIRPPVEANQLMRFTSQVEEVLQSRVMQVVGSWEEGTAMMLSLAVAIPLAEILEKLEGVSEVEEVGETVKDGEIHPKLLKKANAVPKIHGKVRKTFFISLEKSTVGVAS